MKLLALSDLHVGHPDNRSAIYEMKPHPEDWLILGGDLGETEQHLDFVLGTLRDRFARLIWVPGNHELWTVPHREVARGEEKYLRLVELCHRHDVLTPEDAYVLWPGPPGPRLIAPLFLLYDYSFRPADVPVERAVDWAREAGIECVDEHVLHPDPYPSRPAWCEARCRETAARLEAALALYDVPSVLINHFPLRKELAVLPLVPRFTVWCGTERTEDWHLRFRAEVVVFGHLHIRQTRMIDGVRFEEVSLGYARQWRRERGVDAYLRQILPGVPATSGGGANEKGFLRREV
jgi:predicted phosphodiesterase